MRNTTTTDSVLSRYCKALAHPARVRIVRLLLKRGMCQTGLLVDELPLAQSTVSEHLRILREAGLIVGEVDGPRRCYCVEPEALDNLRDLFDGLFATSRRRQSQIDSHNC